MGSIAEKKAKLARQTMERPNPAEVARDATRKATDWVETQTKRNMRRAVRLQRFAPANANDTDKG